MAGTDGNGAKRDSGELDEVVKRVGVLDVEAKGELGGSSTGDNAIGHCAFLFFMSRGPGPG